MNELRPIIENSDRGITLNKSLAWTIFSSLVVLVWWGGATLSGVQKTLLALETAQMTDRMETRAALAEGRAESRTANAQVEQRVRTLENTQSRVDAQFTAMRESLDEIKRQSGAIEQMVRQYLQAPKP